MAKKQADEGMTMVRCISDGQFGLCGDVVEVPTALVPQLKAVAKVDDDPDAVAYAMTLPQNQATPQS